MSAPHDETHEMHNEAAAVARAMLSAGLAVADARRQRQLRDARAAERALPQPLRTEPAADRASGPAPERATDQARAEQPAQQPGGGGTLRDPGGFSRRDIQQRADMMAATPGSAEHDARLRDVVAAAVPTTAEAVLADPAWPALRAGLHHIENNGGDPRVELAAAAATRPLRGADSAARVLRGLTGGPLLDVVGADHVRHAGVELVVAGSAAVHGDVGGRPQLPHAGLAPDLAALRPGLQPFTNCTTIVSVRSPP